MKLETFTHELDGKPVESVFVNGQCVAVDDNAGKRTLSEQEALKQLLQDIYNREYGYGQDGE